MTITWTPAGLKFMQQLSDEQKKAHQESLRPEREAALRYEIIMRNSHPNKNGDVFADFDAKYYRSRLFISHEGLEEVRNWMNTDPKTAAEVLALDIGKEDIVWGPVAPESICLCSIDTLMATGCKCGCFEMEQAAKYGGDLSATATFGNDPTLKNVW